MLAYFAMLILGRAADVSYVTEMDNIQESARLANVQWAHFIESAAAKAAMVIRYADNLKASESIQEKLEILSVLSLGQMSPMLAPDLSVEASTERNDPVTVWARAQIHDLSSGSPSEAASTVSHLQFDRSIPLGAGAGSTAEAIRWRYRDRVGSFLDEESRQAYQTVRSKR